MGINDPHAPLPEFYVEVARGRVQGASLVHKFGRNDAVANGSWELISQLSGATSFLSAPTTVRVKAGNAADTAAGAGAREITVTGLDSNLNEVSEAIATNGGSAGTASTTSFWRVYRAFVSSGGTYGAANTGDVVIENGAGGTDLIQISAGEGQSQYGAWAVPTGKTAYLLSVVLTADTSQAADFRMFRRESLSDTTAPVQVPRLMFYWDGIADSFTFTPVSPVKLNGETDVWVEVSGAGGATQASVDFELLVVDDA